MSATSAESIDRLASEIRGKAEWAAILQARLDTSRIELPTGQHIQAALERIRVVLRRGKTADALAVSRVLAFMDSGRFVREVRRHGIFRSSKLAFHGEPIAYVVRMLIDDESVLRWAPHDLLYLQSVRNLLGLASSARATRQALIAELTKRRDVVVKSAMVCVDRAFRPSVDHLPTEAEQFAEITGHPQHFHREQKAAGFSTILSLMQDVVGWPKTPTVLIDEEGIRHGIYERLLRDAAKLGEFMEAEIKLDAYPYRTDPVDGQPRTVQLSALDDRFDQSIHLGYIFANMQWQFAQSMRDADYAQIPALHDIGVELHRRWGDFLIERQREPFDRYVMTIPLTPPLLQLLRDDAVFREEAQYLDQVARDAFVEDCAMRDMTLLPDMPLLDMIKVRRFFAFLAAILFRALDQPAQGGKRDELDMRSRIPVFPEEVLHERLGAILGEAAAARALEVLSFDPAKGGRFDIQYTPFLKVNGHYMVPMNVLIASDLIRNTLYRYQAKLMPADGHDPMVRRLRDVMAHRGFLVAEGVRGTFNGRQIEIDLLACAEGHLFIFEGKNTFHPCSAHEMRTSFGHIKKASTQLTRAVEWLRPADTQAIVFRHLGWSIPPATDIRTCIVMGNRLLSGYVMDGHPVRQVHELLNLVAEGVITFSNGEIYRLWRNESFDVVDLLDHLEGNTLVRDTFEAMVESSIAVELRGGGRLILKSFGIDLEEVLQRVRARYTHVGGPTEEPSNKVIATLG